MFFLFHIFFLLSLTLSRFSLHHPHFFFNRIRFGELKLVFFQPTSHSYQFIFIKGQQSQWAILVLRKDVKKKKSKNTILGANGLREIASGLRKSPC